MVTITILPDNVGHGFHGAYRVYRSGPPEYKEFLDLDFFVTTEPEYDSYLPSHRDPSNKTSLGLGKKKQTIMTAKSYIF